MKPSDLPERFATKIELAPSGCWLWTGFVDKAGYGRIRHALRPEPVGYAHRVSYELHVGPIPTGLTIDHLCRNRSCVNPAHLEPVTQGENSRRGEHPTFVAHREGRCTRGHQGEFYRRPSGPRKGKVAYCLACKREDKVAA